MGVTFFLFFIPITIIFLVGFSFAAMYLCMGSWLLARGYKERSEVKRRNGLISIFISLPVAVILIYVYMEWVWVW